MIIFDPADDGRIGAAEFFRDDVGAKLCMLDADYYGRQLFGRQSAAADLRRGILQMKLKCIA